jgi:hypothetical protein
LGRDVKRWRGKGYTKMYRRRGIERGVRKGILPRKGIGLDGE